MKIKCPNCGAETAKPICEYCGSTVVAPSLNVNANNSGDNAVYILPWPKKYQSDDDLIIKCFTILRDQKDAPVDVFSYITDVKVNRYYLPMRQFNGSVSTDWSCIQVFERKRIVDYEIKDGKRKPIYEYYDEYLPANGKGYGNFNFLVAVAVKEGLPKPLVSCLGTIQINKNITEKALPLSSSLIVDGASIIDEDHTMNDNKIVDKAEKRIDIEADNASFHNLSGRLKDCNFTYQWKYGTANNKRLLVPAATVSYTYKGKEYTTALVFNCDSRKEYPKEENNFTKEIDTKSKKFTKTGWLIFALSFVLTIVIFFVWGDMNPQPLRVISTFGTILMTIIIAWKALLVSAKYDEIKKHVYELFSIRRTDSLKKAFPRYANHPAVNKVSTDESDTQTKISKSFLSIRKSQRALKHLILVQIFLIVGGFFNMYSINEHKKAEIRAEQARIFEQERQERERIESVKQRIFTELKGKTYTGGNLYGGNGLTINFLGNNKLSYSFSSNYRYSGCEWSSPKTALFNIEAKEVSYGERKWYKILISFGKYSSKEIEVHDNISIRDFIIVNKEDDSVVGESYSLYLNGNSLPIQF